MESRISVIGIPNDLMERAKASHLISCSCDGYNTKHCLASGQENVAFAVKAFQTEIKRISERELIESVLEHRDKHKVVEVS